MKRKNAKVLKFKTLIEQDEDGFFMASVPAIPGCHTQGDTYEEAIKNVQEAIELCLEAAEDDPFYKKQIRWPSAASKKRFSGAADVPIKFPMAT
ncbi:MAG: type II toxin-antitoxin system HicB family antitoxin [Patescibacteria group bacterium]